MYPDENSVSARLHKQAKTLMPGGNTRHSVLYPPYPLYMASGDGCRLTDVDGVTRIDCVNNMSALIHGHGNAAVLAAVRDQASRMLCAGAPTEAEIELAEALVGRLPGVDRVRFTSSGSEAVMFACRAARAYTGREKIAKIEGAYHGSYDAVEFGLSPTPDCWGDAVAPATVPATHGITKATQDDTIVLPFNDVVATRAILEANADQLAAVLIDPFVSRMGFMRASQEYLDLVRQHTRDSGSLLVFDEVFSFRVAFDGAQGAVDVTPDLTVLGKVIGGGLPIGAVAGQEQYMAVFDHAGGVPSVEHSGTFFGNPLSMAAGAAALAHLTPDALERLNSMGEILREELRNALQECGVAGYVTGVGSLSAIILGEKEPTDYRGLFRVMAGGALEKGMILHRYLLNAGVQVIPPGGITLSTPMTRQDLDEIIAAFRAGLRFVA